MPWWLAPRSSHPRRNVSGTTFDLAPGEASIALDQTVFVTADFGDDVEGVGEVAKGHVLLMRLGSVPYYLARQTHLHHVDPGAAVHREDLPRDIRGRIAHEEEHRVCDVPFRADVAQRVAAPASRSSSPASANRASPSVSAIPPGAIALTRMP